MKLRTFSNDISDYVFIKELSGYFYNGYLVFDATSVLKTDGDLSNYFSLFMIFGYENGTNYTKDISFLFSDSDNYNPNKNFVSFLHDNIIIDNICQLCFNFGRYYLKSNKPSCDGLFDVVV